MTGGDADAGARTSAPGPSVGRGEADARAEPDLDVALLRDLLAEQHPQWAGLPLTPLDHTGTDHVMVRLGARLVVRAPRVPWAARTLRIEAQWLPRIAAALPVPAPVPLAVGEPSQRYPWPWSVCPWLPGACPVPGELADPDGLAGDLATLIRALRGLDTAGAPPTVWPSPLHEEDRRVRELLPGLTGVDTEAVAAAWGHALAAVACRQHTWIHGDLAAGNLLLREGRLAGVIDFSAMGVGDPASDLRPAWNLLDGRSRSVLRAALGSDDAQWARGRGWALLQAVAQLARFAQSNPWLAAGARRTLAEIADEVRAGHL